MNILFGPPHVPGLYVVHRHMCREKNTYTQKHKFKGEKKDIVVRFRRDFEQNAGNKASVADAMILLPEKDAG